MSILADLHGFRFNTGTSAVESSTVPALYPVALAGRAFLLDEKQDWGHDSIPQLHPQFLQDVGNQSAEATLNPEALKRKSQDSWHHGAGQTYLDRPESDNLRFRSSKGIDIWTRWQISLLWDTARKRTSANTNLQVLPVGTHLYVADGNEVYWTTDITTGSPTFTASTINVAEGAQAVSSIASDGYNVWAALGPNGIHTTTRGASVSTHYSDLTGAQVLGYVNGRLMAAKDNAVYNITASGAAPTALFTQPNTDFRWVGFASGPTHLYFAGYSGDKSLIYKSTVKADGTGLDVATIAGTLPDGEIVTAIDNYVGFILLGTSKGWRFCQITTNGNLEIGSRIDTSSSVQAFEGQDNFIWWGMTNYDASSTGLGRMDPTQITDAGALTPAWASDLMATAQGSVTSIATFQSVRVFAVAASGVWVEDRTNRVPSGTLDTGLITYGTPDTKVAVFLDTRYRGTDGSHTAWISVDGGSFETIGTHSGGETTQFPLGPRRGETFEIRVTLTRSSTTTLTPIITRQTLKAEVAADPGVYHLLPLRLYEKEHVGGQDRHRDVGDDLRFLRALRSDRTLAILQEGDQSYAVVMVDFQWRPHHQTNERKAWNGTFLAKLKEIV